MAAQWFLEGRPDMPALTIKNMPDEVYRRLKESARLNRRSLNSEAIVLLERSLGHRRRSADTGKVLALAGASGASAYDCEFVALAEELGVPLVTADRRLAERFPAIAVELRRFVVGDATGAPRPSPT